MEPNQDPKNRPRSATPDEIKAAYEKAKSQFGIEDLLPILTEEDGVPFEDLLAEITKKRSEGKSST